MTLAHDGARNHKNATFFEVLYVSYQRWPQYGILSFLSLKTMLQLEEMKQVAVGTVYLKSGLLYTFWQSVF